MNMKRLGAVVEAGSAFGFRPLIFLVLVSSLVPVQAQEALPPLQFNVPYRCADGTTYLIQRCERGSKGEVCFFHYEGNESERYMARSQFTDMIKRCPVSPAAAKPAAQPGPTATIPIGIPNRPTDPPSQREMPSLDRVIREIQDAARQQGKSPIAGNDSRTPAKPVTVVGPPDPGIAKARAANVDTKVFGIALGEPLALPKCTGGILGPPPSTNCIDEHEFLNALGNAVASAVVGPDPDPGAGTAVEIQLTPSNCPTWMECSFYATIQNGRFVAARLRTRGRDVEAAAGKELRGKYGQRASRQQRFITPNNGGSKFEVWDLDWEFPGLHVEYKVVDATILDGVVLIESETVYNVRKANLREAAKPKL